MVFMDGYSNEIHKMLVSKAPEHARFLQADVLSLAFLE
jgi:hypothetical protein